MISIKRDYFAYLDEMSVITILLPYSYHDGHSSQFYLETSEGKYPLIIKEKQNLETSIKYICQLTTALNFGETYWIIDEHHGKTDLQIGAVIRTPEFDEIFFYDGLDLGVTYSNEASLFKIWAPTATKVSIKLITPEGSSEICPMHRGENGVWSIHMDGNLNRYQYTFLVCINLRWREAVDPYAIAVTANGEHGVIVDLSKTRAPKPKLPPFEHPVDAIIYETHVRDFTIHPQSGIQKKGKYLGFCELGTSTEETGITGLSYLKDLGITHLELLPIHDFVGIDELGDYSDYNWGYNPLHFKAPEGSYATNPADPYSRIIELKTLIRTVQENGIRIIFDVVYNHVYDRENSSFEKIVPGYYFRHDQFGMPSNGTGVGNDIASERRMVRKFILDSVRFWILEYGVDGLRFDLMGILDIETMNDVRALVDQLDPTLLIVGEGWDLNTPIPPEKKATIKNQEKLPRIAQFNDFYRDTIKGSTFHLKEKGFIHGKKTQQAKLAISGSIDIEQAENGLFLEPSQSLNYVESHDNHTIWDKLIKMCPNEKEEILRKHQRLATTILLLSQGIPFLHSGQEFYRTKGGIGNSYQSNDEINRIDWVRKQLFEKDVQFIKGIIALRKANQAFRLRSAEQIRSHLEWMDLPSPLIGYRLKNIQAFGTWQELVVIFNPENVVKDVQLHLSGKWCLLVNDQQAGNKERELELKEINRIATISTLVIGKREEDRKT